MRTLHGLGYGTRPTLGRATRLTKDASGRPVLEENLPGILALRAQREEGPLDLVVIADDPALALLLPLPEGACLVGVVAERRMHGPPAWLPEGMAVLTGVDDALLSVGEGEIVLVEPGRGRATIEPGAAEIARLQAIHRPRMLLGAQHTPARTLGGLDVPVWAAVETLDDALDAVEAGADGLFFAQEPDSGTLLAAADAMGGGSLALFGSLDTVTALSTRALVYWCLDDRADAASHRAALDARIQAAEAEGAPPHPAVRIVGSGPGSDEALVENGILPDDIFAWPPLRARASSVDDAVRAVSAGAIGVIVAPHQIAATKDALRELP